MQKLLLTLSLLSLAQPCQAQTATASTAAAKSDVETVWKCSRPTEPMRFARNELEKATPPKCERWLEIRSKKLSALLSELGDERFTAANVFLKEASDVMGTAYPGGRASPARAADLYKNAGNYDLKVVSVDKAAPGSLVVFENHGGILVEMREEGTETWQKGVLYPSARSGYKLNVAEYKEMSAYIPDAKVMVMKKIQRDE